MIRTFADTEKYPRDILKGFRHLNFEKRTVSEYTGTGWKILYSNQTCMRFIEVCIMDEGWLKII